MTDGCERNGMVGESLAVKEQRYGGSKSFPLACAGSDTGSLPRREMRIRCESKGRRSELRQRRRQEAVLVETLLWMTSDGGEVKCDRDAEVYS